MANSISLINRLSPSVLKLGAKVVGNSASKSHPIKSGTFLLDGSPVTVKSGDDLKKIAKKISNSSRHITAKVKEHKGKFRLVIETTKSKMRFVDPDGVLKKLNSDGLIGTKNDSFVQIKGSHGQSVQVIFDNYRLPNRASGLTVALQEILAKTKSGNTLPYVHVESDKLPEVEEGEEADEAEVKFGELPEVVIDELDELPEVDEGAEVEVELKPEEKIEPKNAKVKKKGSLFAMRRKHRKQALKAIANDESLDFYKQKNNLVPSIKVMVVKPKPVVKMYDPIANLDKIFAEAKAKQKSNNKLVPKLPMNEQPKPEAKSVAEVVHKPVVNKLPAAHAMAHTAYAKNNPLMKQADNKDSVEPKVKSELPKTWYGQYLDKSSERNLGIKKQLSKSQYKQLSKFASFNNAVEAYDRLENIGKEMKINGSVNDAVRFLYNRVRKNLSNYGPHANLKELFVNRHFGQVQDRLKVKDADKHKPENLIPVLMAYEVLSSGRKEKNPYTKFNQAYSKKHNFFMKYEK